MRTRCLVLCFGVCSGLADTSFAQTETPTPTPPASEPSRPPPEPEPEPTPESPAPAPALDESTPTADAPDEPPVPSPPGAQPPARRPEPGYREVTEPKSPASRRPGGANADAEQPGTVYEPPLPNQYPISEPPLPPVPKHRAPMTSLWVGAKAGMAFPTGNIWLDGRQLDRFTVLLEGRRFQDFAGPGPKLELNLGARLARRYNVFGLWEFASLSPGDLLANDLEGQNQGTMHFIGGGFRFSSDPDEVGVLVEVAAGYRVFTASWQSGTELTAKDDLLNIRLAFGADIRLTEDLALSPMLGLAGGFFEEIRWTFSDGTRSDALSRFDAYGQHSVVTLDVGLHYDLIRSKQ